MKTSVLTYVLRIVVAIAAALFIANTVHSLLQPVSAAVTSALGAR